LDSFSINHVDLDWLIDSETSDEDAIKFVIRTVLCRDPTNEEHGSLLAYLESSADDRRERFATLYEAVRQSYAAATVGIYELKGDRLVVCFAAPGKPRPKNLGIGKDGGQLLMTFKRVSPDKVSSEK
jgi:hypothetical protein